MQKNKSLNYKINPFKLNNTLLVEVLLLSYIRTHATPLQQSCLQTFKRECKIIHGFSPVYSSHNIVSPALIYFTDKDILCQPSISMCKINNNNNNNYYNYIHTDRCRNTYRQKGRAKRSRKEAKMQKFMYGDIQNVEKEVYYYTGRNWRHRNQSKRFIEKFESHTKKSFNRFTKNDEYTQRYQT